MIPAHLEGIGRLESVQIGTTVTRLIAPIGTALHEHRERRIVFVRVRGSEAEGVGELSAMDEVVGTDPTIDQVLAALRQQWIPRLFDAARSRQGQCPASHAIGVLGGSAGVDRMSASVLEMAILDGELRRAGKPLARWLEVEASSVPYGALCGIPSDRSIGALVEVAAAALGSGASRLRIKIDPTWAVEPLARLRGDFPSAVLQADANGSLKGDAGLRVLRGIDHLALTCIEEPLGSPDLTASAALGEILQTPICLDESVTSPRMVRDALRYGSCRALCVKPGRLGGIRAALRALDEAHRAGVACFVGGMFEAGLGRSALGALAGRGESSLVSDVAGASSYLVEDPCGQPQPADGLQALHLDPGVGPWPDSDLFDAGWEDVLPGL